MRKEKEGREVLAESVLWEGREKEGKYREEHKEPESS